MLEKAIGAEKILMYGLSLGGGAQAEAIKSHHFKKDNHSYLAWSDRTFDTLSHAASQMVTKWVKPLFFILGIELDGVGGAQKLQELDIKHIVVQNSEAVDQDGALPLTGEIHEEGTDGVIPNPPSLYVGLRKAGMKDSDHLKCYGGPSIDHNALLPKQITDLIEADIQAFVAAP